jgi:single-strand DNA-binding protein
MFNKVVLVGNLTRDIELRYTQGGMPIANTAIATTRKFTSNGERREETMFIDITFFQRSAEIANQYLHKGSKVLIEGRLKFDQWVAADGSKRSKHSVSVEMMQMLDSKGDYQQNSAPGQNQSYNNSGSYNNNNYNNSNTNSYSQNQYDTPTQQPYNTQQNSAPQQSTQQQNQQPYNLPEIDIDEDEIPF